MTSLPGSLSSYEGRHKRVCSGLSVIADAYKTKKPALRPAIANIAAKVHILETNLFRSDICSLFGFDNSISRCSQGQHSTAVGEYFPTLQFRSRLVYCAIIHPFYYITGLVFSRIALGCQDQAEPITLGPCQSPGHFSPGHSGKNLQQIIFP